LARLDVSSLLWPHSTTAQWIGARTPLVTATILRFGQGGRISVAFGMPGWWIHLEDERVLYVSSAVGQFASGNGLPS
jgi:hypothetical protein